jgi:hypothetical protein
MVSSSHVIPARRSSLEVAYDTGVPATSEYVVGHSTDTAASGSSLSTAPVSTGADESGSASEGIAESTADAESLTAESDGAAESVAVAVSVAACESTRLMAPVSAGTAAAPAGRSFSEHAVVALDAMQTMTAARNLVIRLGRT